MKFLMYVESDLYIHTCMVRVSGFGGWGGGVAAPWLGSDFNFYILETKKQKKQNKIR